MRWKFADAVDGLRPWSGIEGRKTVSLEEGTLLAPHGFPSGIPRTLALEALVHLAGWLVAASSDFTTACVLTGIPRLDLERGAVPGEVLDLSASVSARDPESLQVEVRAASGGANVCSGTLELGLLPLQGLLDRNEARAAWRSLTRRITRSSPPEGRAGGPSFPPPRDRG